MTKKTFIFLLFQLKLIPLFWGQTPYHFFLGKEELSSIDIYDVHQDAKENYWFATDNSLYKYDGYFYQQFTHPVQLSNSLFNIIEDENGNIYCNNLNGQIFKVSEDEMTLFHEVPATLLTPYISTEIDNQNNLIIHSKDLYLINLFDKKITTLIKEKTGHNHLANLYKSTNGSVLFHYWTDSISVIQNNHLKCYFLDWQKYKNPKIASFFNLLEVNNQLYLENTGKEIYSLDTSKTTWNIIPVFKQEKELTRIYNTEKGLWLAKNTTGVQFIHLNNKTSLKNSLPVLFSKHFISNVYEDHKNNILLSTFGEGIIVIPNTGSTIVWNNEDVKISQFAVAKDKTLYIGGYDGVVYKYDNQHLDSLFFNGFKRIELLELIDNDSSILFDQNTSIIFNLITQTKTPIFASGSVKNIKKIDSENYILASNEYAVKFNINHPNQSEKIYTGRSYAIEPLNDNEFLLATSVGLLHIKDKIETKLLYHNKFLLVSTIFKLNEKILIGTKKNGILEWTGTELLPYLSTENNLSSNSITDIQNWKNYLFILTDERIEVFDNELNPITIMAQSDGLFESKVKRFRIVGDDIWCHTSIGLQTIQIEKLIASKYTCVIKSLELFVNNEKQEEKNNPIFSHIENKVKFFVNAPNLERQNDISYQFKLEPIEHSWNEQSYSKNIIDYKALPPGKYKFKVNLIYKGNIHDSKTIEFSIDYPFWQKWWFFALFGGLIVFISYLFYKRRLAIQEGKSRQINELNALKLAAIQSQMNPHFIFNSMNSIQDLVLKGDVDNSYTFITKFSNLVRRTLSYSDKEFIDFDQEIKLLELYLSLEKLRFKDTLEYEISSDKFDDIMVPPMLIQPFIENALIHGLLHKKGIRKLNVHFELKEQLICIITDNGIGREKANEIKQRQRSDHESFSSNAIKKRFEILNRYFSESLGFVFEDLTENNEPIGTKVTIRIPVKYKY